MANLIANADFARLDSSGWPAGWHAKTPRRALRPKFAFDRSISRGGAGSLRISGNGDPLAFGCWTTRVPLEPGKTYRGRIYCRTEGVADPNLSVLVNLFWGSARRLVREEYFRAWSPAGDWLRGEHVFRAPQGEDSAALQLYFRSSAQGSAWFSDPEVMPARAPAHRKVKVATTFFETDAPSTKRANLRRIARHLDTAGGMGADIVLLPEMATTAGVAYTRLERLAEPVPGPASRLYCRKAKQHGMWVLGWLYERDGPHVFNTTLVVDRGGRLAGRYRKTHPHWPECRLGVSAGADYPVFETDFGTIGVMICYDSWFPIVSQVLAFNGAEIVFLPNAGYEPFLFQTRCLDSNVYGVVSSFSRPSMIVDADGQVLAETSRDGVIASTLDLDDRVALRRAYDSRFLTYANPGSSRLTLNTLDYTAEREALRLLQEPEGG